MELSQFDFCNDSNVLQIFYIIKILFKALGIIIPIILIVLISIDFIKGVAGNKKSSDEVLSTALRRIVSAVIIFFIPIIVNLSMNLLTATTIDEYVRGEVDNYKPTLSSCWTNATDAGIDSARILAESVD